MGRRRQIRFRSAKICYSGFHLLANLLLRSCATTRCAIFGTSFAFAPRVEFAENFLNDKFQRPTDWFVFAQMMSNCASDFEPRQFFRNIGAIGEKKNFLGQAFVIHANHETSLFDSSVRASRNFHDSRMKRADFLEQLPDCL